MKSYTRFFFDSNNRRVVPIDGDGSERRYLVMEISEHKRYDKEYFKALYREIEGDGMQALLAELQDYDPASDGLDWGYLREAPDTPERRMMRWHTMPPVERALLKVFEDGELTLRSSSGEAYRYVFEANVPIRIPASELNAHLESSRNRYEAKEGDVAMLMESLFGRELTDQNGKCWTVAKTLRGRVDCEVEDDGEWQRETRQAMRCYEFPPIDLLRAEIERSYHRDCQPSTLAEAA